MYESLGRDVLLSPLDGVYTDYLTIWIKMVTPKKILCYKYRCSKCYLITIATSCLWTKKAECCTCTAVVTIHQTIELVPEIIDSPTASTSAFASSTHIIVLFMIMFCRIIPLMCLYYGGRERDSDFQTTVASNGSKEQPPFTSRWVQMKVWTTKLQSCRSRQKLQFLYKVYIHLSS
jgi:hypothetical protein